MKILTDEMVDLLRDAMDGYAEADDKDALRYADRLFATVDAMLSMAIDADGTARIVLDIAEDKPHENHST